MNLTMTQIKADIIAANQAISYYDENNIRDIKNVAAYHIQQAVEKMIKIQIYASGSTVNYAGLYTHNIEKLLLYAKNNGIALNVPKYVADNSLVLTSWEAGSRYDVGFQIRIDTLKRAFSVTENWYQELYGSGLRQA